MGTIAALSPFMHSFEYKNSKHYPVGPFPERIPVYGPMYGKVKRFIWPPEAIKAGQQDLPRYYSMQSDFVSDFRKKIMRKQKLSLDALAENYNQYSETLDLSNGVIEGELLRILQALQTSPLFKEVKKLKLSHNSFKTELNAELIDLLPPNLESLDMSHNELFGSNIPWDQFPLSLQRLYLQNNALGGDIEWKSLPKQLVALSVRNNVFDCVIEWQHINGNLKVLIVTDKMAKASRVTMPKTDWERKSGIYTMFLRSAFRRTNADEYI